MKRTRKVFWQIMLTVALSMSMIASNVSALSVSQPLNEEVTSGDFLGENNSLNLKHEILLKEIMHNPEMSRFYGGCFIDEYRVLNVVVVGMQQDFVTFCKHALGEGIKYVNGDFSYEQLHQTQRELERKLIEEKEFIRETSYNVRELAERIVSFGICERDNRLIIDVYNKKNDDGLLIKELCSNEKAIMLVNSGKLELNTTRSPGAGADIGTHGTYSIGYSAYGDTPTGHHVGFITAAHGGITIGETVKFGAVTVGSVFAVSYSNYCDAAFVELTTNNNVSHTISYGGGTLSSQYKTTFTEGDTIKMAGQASATIRSGIITRASVTFSGVLGMNTCYDCIETSYDANNGDSGGIVYQPISGVNYIAGIHKGKKWTEYPPGTGNYWHSYVVKAKNIATYMGAFPN